LYLFLSNPNVGEQVPRKWEAYSNEKAYLKLSTDLLNQTEDSESPVKTERGIRDELYKFWFDDTNRNRDCNPADASASKVYKSANPGMHLCFELLDNSTEYNYLDDMFLLEYEKCMNSVESVKPSMRGFFSTFCLDVIVIRRLQIEYDLCCVKNAGRANSTLCGIRNFNKKLLSFNLTMLIDHAGLSENKAIQKTTEPKLNENKAASSFASPVFLVYIMVHAIIVHFY
jgi:hypothetical protein